MTGKSGFTRQLAMSRVSDSDWVSPSLGARRNTGSRSVRSSRRSSSPPGETIRIWPEPSGVSWQVCPGQLTWPTLPGQRSGMRALLPPGVDGHVADRRLVEDEARDRDPEGFERHRHAALIPDLDRGHVGAGHPLRWQDDLQRPAVRGERPRRRLVRDGEVGRLTPFRERPRRSGADSGEPAHVAQPPPGCPCRHLGAVHLDGRLDRGPPRRPAWAGPGGPTPTTVATEGLLQSP